MDAEVIVVGGGPGGSATAWALARAGVDVLVLDRATFPREKPCAEYLSPQASRILHDMGVLTSVEAHGAAQLAGMVVRAPNGAEIHGEFAASHGFHGFRDQGLALRRRDLDPLLLGAARARGARVIEDTRVVDLARDARTGRIEGVRIGADRVLRAPLVIGADGLHSIVARRMGVLTRSRWPGRIALVTHYRGVQGMGACGEMHVERDGYVGLANVGHGETNVALVVPAPAVRLMKASQPEAFLTAWIARRPHLAPRFVGAVRVSPIRFTGPFAQRARPAWAPGAALVGDAADFFDPFTGEGIYAALRGGELLLPYAVEAARGSARRADVALAAYERCRRHEFGGKWWVERIVGAAVGRPALLNRAARVLARRRDLADLLVGVTGDFVPAREVLRPSYLIKLLTAS